MIAAKGFPEPLSRVYDHNERDSISPTTVGADREPTHGYSLLPGNAFLLEEAILYEAVQQDADYVVIGKKTKARWRQLLTDRLGIDIDLEAFLQHHLNATLLVV